MDGFDTWYWRTTEKIKLLEKLTNGVVWSIALCSPENWTVRKLERKLFGWVRYMVLEDNGENKIVRESN